MPVAELNSGLGVLSAFVRAGLVASTGEARRQIKGGELKVNDAAVTNREGDDHPRGLAGERASSSCRSVTKETCVVAGGVGALKGSRWGRPSRPSACVKRRLRTRDLVGPPRQEEVPRLPCAITPASLVLRRREAASKEDAYPSNSPRPGASATALTCAWTPTPSARPSCSQIFA